VEGLASQGQEIGRQEKVQRTSFALHATEHPLEKSQTFKFISHNNSLLSSFES
jgi:hypothetical protein